MTDTTLAFGFVASGSTSSSIKVNAYSRTSGVGAVGRQAYVDIQMDDGVHRALGTITDIFTQNKMFDDPNLLSVAAREKVSTATGTDLRSFTLKIQSTFFRSNDTGTWTKGSSALPTSPGTDARVVLIDEAMINELVGPTEDIVHIGTMRGLRGVDAPLTLANFDSERGATHTAFLGRSGSGKTGGATYVLAAQMHHENHAIIVVDPQGQWANENGFVFSLQAFAEGLGRPVSVLRVAEDIRLPLDDELLGRLCSHIDMWGRGLRRMGNENKQAFSEEVASFILRDPKATEKDPRELLEGVFAKIASSNSALRRIYASDDKRDDLKEALQILAGEKYAPTDEDGAGFILSEEDIEDAEESWEKILARFTPLINLFARTNLSGGTRRSLGGNAGFLTDVMKVRSENPDVPAPYVILDMSSDTASKAKAAYAQGTKTKNDDAVLANMKRVLDNDDIKAIIITALLKEIKSKAEVVFQDGSGNLNTQIVFDEAWRYARNTSGISGTPIGDLSEMLEGFSLDTRKYGIGWTYILQVPSDLNKGIWRQLSNVYTGYGIIGSDKKMLSELMDEKDRDAQMGLYDQFAPPSSTKVYPFMINGPMSPLIFTNTPVFIDMYTNVSDFLQGNAHWIDPISTKRGKGSMVRNPGSLQIGSVKPRRVVPVPPVAAPVAAESTNVDNVAPTVKNETFKIGGTKMGAPTRHSTTRVEAVKPPVTSKAKPFGVDAPPF